MNEFGEFLIPGIIGRYSIYLSILAALVSAVLLFRSFRENNIRLRKAALILYYAHFALLIIVATVLLWLIFGNYFEYKNVWTHSSADQHWAYKLTALWAGQEGSLLFWTLLNATWGLFLIRKKDELSMRSLSIIAIVQSILLLLITGFSIGSLHLGNDLFVLLRESPENIGIPFFNQTNYLQILQDGLGLNPLLKNIWMILHPPILFFGYSLCLVPWAFAISVLIKNPEKIWLHKLIPWLLSASLFLGAGLLLGGAWAYEDLTFGGFWAWDPVENASLVPWLIIIATFHLVIVHRKNSKPGLSVYLFLLLPLILIFYSAFLTRSGILGEQSVHSFSGSGSFIPLMMLPLLSLLFPAILMIIKRKQRGNESEEKILSRPFWISVGVVVLFLSAFQVLFSTSLPVINNLLGTSIALPSDRAAHFNTWQAGFAFVILMLAAISLFVKNVSGTKAFLIRLIVPCFGALLMLIPILFFTVSLSFLDTLLWFAASFLLIAALDFQFRFRKVSRNSPSAVTHAGIGVFVVGVLIAFTQNETITQQPIRSNAALNSDYLELKPRIPLATKNYQFMFDTAYTKDEKTIFAVEVKDRIRKKTVSVYPEMIVDEQRGAVYIPGISRKWDADIFAFVYGTNEVLQKKNENVLFQEEVKIMDTTHVGSIGVIVDSMNCHFLGKKNDFENAEYNFYISVISDKGHLHKTSCLQRTGGKFRQMDSKSDEQDNLVVDVFDFSKEKDHVLLRVSEVPDTFIAFKAVRFPLISLVWLGGAMILAGFTMAWIRRSRKKYEL
ncbi:MAG: cytochrome c biogenesis protein CcsA [Bacteroidota bacterium]